MRASVAFFLAVVLLLAFAQEISGPAQILDGDTLQAAGQSIRLPGIDAPESKQTCIRDRQRWPCGKPAADYLVRPAA